VPPLSLCDTLLAQDVLRTGLTKMQVYDSFFEIVDLWYSLQLVFLLCSGARVRGRVRVRVRACVWCLVAYAPVTARLSIPGLTKLMLAITLRSFVRCVCS
jgi:hypothetical protein